MQIICLIICLIEATTLVLAADFEALLDLKKGIQSDPSANLLNSWSPKSLTSDGCPENWYGITCSAGRVTVIVLDNIGLVGDFSFATISSLSMLQNLSIASNQLTGNISEVDSGFNRLKRLDLHGNGFVGDAMHLISLLGSIQYLDLSSNQFTGSVDTVGGNSSFVSSIQYLNISSNLLVGELFAHDGMPFFDSLEVFDGSNNKLVGKMPSFNFVVSLRILRLGNNQLSGSLPQALLQDSSMILSELDLSSNQLEGPVGTITSATLKKLNLSSNKLSGSLPVSVGHCALVHLSNNALSGNFSRIQGWGNYVEVIQLSSNSLSGTLPVQTSQFLRLTTLRVSNNFLEGGLPEVLGTYPELKVLDLSFNRLSGPLLPSLFNSTKLADLNLSGNNLIGPIPSLGNAQNPSLASLDLANNSLSGTLEINGFHGLEYLNLSRNNFDGAIPDDLPDGLRGLDISYNNLSGTVPGNLRQFPDSAFHPGNSLLIFPFTPSSSEVGPEQSSGVRGSRMKPAVRITLIAGLVGVVCLVAFLFLIVYFCRRREDSKQNVLNRNPDKITEQPSNLTGFDLNRDSGFVSEPVQDSPVVEKLKDIRTEHFSENQNPTVLTPDKLEGELQLFDDSFQFMASELSRAPAEVVGRSCHGTLYRARLDSGLTLAVKWLREGIAKGRKDFSREVRKLGGIKHPNLVSLQGFYCSPREYEKLIVSKYIDGASLDLYLHETVATELKPLSVETRLRIAIDVARCLSFLHNERAIPHGNLKSSNVLLEMPELNTLITDYSLHRLMTPSGTTEQVVNSGALGYRPPEFASSSKPCPSLKSDVYAFGIILLELLTGKSSGEIVCGDPGIVDLTDWVRLLAGKGRAGECYDNRVLLSGHNNLENPRRVLDGMLHMALRCILPASERPDIKTVLEELSGIALAVQSSSGGSSSIL